MNLSKICIDPTLRNGWQAIDLGFLLARRWYVPLFVSWFVPTLPLFLILSVIFFEHSWVAVLIVWWLKPLWDRLPLSLASRALFSEPLEVRSTVKKSFSLFKRDWFSWLTWRRLNPVRSFDMPVTLLEGLGGSERARRLTVLHQMSSNAALWLTLICLGAELVLYDSMSVIVAAMIPDELKSEWFTGFSDAEFFYYTYLDSVFLYFAMILIAPIYTVAGFIIYISRRIDLEGWDIEIRFRHLMNKIESKKKASIQKSRKSTVVAVFFTIFFAGNWTAAPPTLAQEEEEPEFVAEYYRDLNASDEASSAKNKIAEVLSGEDFHRVEIESGWREKIESSDAEEDPGAVVDFLERIYDITAPIRRLFSGAASGFEILIWVLIAVVIGLVIYLFRDSLAAMAGYRKNISEEDEKPQVLFGLDVRKESLPDDVPRQVMVLWNQGRAREAVGLLYRASLSKLIHQFSYEFYDGYTEQECVNTVKVSRNTAVSNYLVRLTSAWQFIAYAHKNPQTTEVAALCELWPQLFEEDKNPESDNQKHGESQS